jgi:DNA-binding transcriptional MerR regulator
VRIGELSRRCRVPVRMLRYYEERGLLVAGRGSNGYREYTEADVDRATLVSSLVRSGLPTRLIIPLLGGGAERAGDGLAELFAAESARLKQRIDCMTLSRDAIEEHLQAMRGTDHR